MPTFLTTTVNLAPLQRVSGKVLTSTTMGLDNAEDPLAKETQQERERLGQQKPGRRPDYTLSGKIIEDRDNAGSIRQTTYFFQLSP